MRSAWRAGFALVTETFHRFDADGCGRIAAAMSYFLLLALAPAILIASTVVTSLGLNAGAGGAGPLATAAERASASIGDMVAWAGTLGPYVTLLLVIIGAMSVFGQFISALNLIWKMPPSGGAARGLVLANVVALGLLVVATVAFGAAIVVASVISLLGSFALQFVDRLDLGWASIVLSLVARSALVFAAAMLFFWVAFKAVPWRGTKWRDAFPGALVAAALFLVGEVGLSVYLSSTERFNFFGTMQFFVVLIVWIYYSALVVLWGAEFARLVILAAEERRESR